MTEFISDIKCIPYNETKVFRVLSDLSKLELIKDKLPQERISNFSCDSDSCSFVVDPFGNITFQVSNRTPNSGIDFLSKGLPFDLLASIELEKKSDNETLMRIIIRADLNPIIKQMVSSQIKEGIDKLAEAIASFSYDEL